LSETSDEVRLFVVPYFTGLSAVREVIGGRSVLRSAKNMHSAEAGA
jgi:triosephosphate isomerase